MRTVPSVFLQILPAAENVAFVSWHLQRFLDGVCEAVTCESEILKHGVMLIVSCWIERAKLNLQVSNSVISNQKFSLVLDSTLLHP